MKTSHERIKPIDRYEKIMITNEEPQLPAFVWALIGVIMISLLLAVAAVAGVVLHALSGGAW